MLGALRLLVTTSIQAILDIGWGGSEGIMLKWEDTTSNWEDLTG